MIFVNRYFYPDHSATSQLLSDLAFDLAARGHDIHVITGGQLYTDPHVVLRPQETIRGVRVQRVRTSRFGRARLWGRMLDYLTFDVGATWHLLRATRPGDVVTANTDPPMLSVCAALAVAIKRGALVNWTQDLFPETAVMLRVPGVRRVAPLLKRLRNWSLRRARMNVVLGSLMAKRLREEGIAPERITVIDNWADGDAIRPVPKANNPLLREWRLEGQFVVGYSGNMGLAHEFDTVMAAADLLKEEKEIAFVFIGDGAARPRLEAEATRLDLTNVQFRPYQPAAHLRWSLGVPDVHLVSLKPSLEGLVVPSKFCGVAAAGRPVIYVGDPDGEIARVLKREGCGWCVPVGEAAALATLVRMLSRSPDEVTETGRRARCVFDRQYARTHALQRWREILDPISASAPRCPKPVSHASSVVVERS